MSLPTEEDVWNALLIASVAWSIGYALGWIK